MHSPPAFVAIERVPAVSKVFDSGGWLLGVADWKSRRVWKVQEAAAMVLETT